MLRKIISQIVSLLRSIYHRLFPIPTPPTRHHIYDARELFFHENMVDGFNRYDMIVRLLAVENYYNKNNFGFDLYRKMQEARHVPGWEGAVDRFYALIKSYEDNGYDSKSEIILDKNLHLWDGSHRLALAFYHKCYPVSCSIEPITHDVYYGIAWFVEHSFSVEEIKKIQERYQSLKNEIAVPFICTLWAPVADYFDEIVDKLQLLCPVISYADYEYDEFGYAQIVRKVYAVDDIEKWKIEKKLEYMRLNAPNGRWKVRVVKLDLEFPDFRQKASNYNTLSRTCEGFKRVIRNAYKDKVPNYFYDIICHIGDNFYQNDFIDKLFEYKRLDVSKIVDAIQSYEYVLTKMDVPYIPKDFPMSYPLGKDMDVVCLKNDYDKLVSEITDTVWQMQLPYEVNVIVKSSCRTLVRIELQKQLIYQIDISYQLDELNDEFTQEMIEKRQKQSGYYIPAIEHELIIRYFDYSHNSSKTWHRDFIRANICQANKAIIMRYAPMIYHVTEQH